MAPLFLPCPSLVCAATTNSNYDEYLHLIRQPKVLKEQVDSLERKLNQINRH